MCWVNSKDSIADSVHRVFEGSINDRLHLEGWNVQEKKIISPDGAVTSYKGASRNPNSIQSAQGYKYSWFGSSDNEPSVYDKLLHNIKKPGADLIGLVLTLNQVQII